MNRAEALKVLRLDREGDGKAVEQSYWSLVRRAQSRGADPRAQSEIERLNAAYAILAPAAEPQAATSRRKSAAPAGSAVRTATPRAPAFFFPDEILAWSGREAARVRARWHNRNPEVALISGAGLVLTVLALAAGAPIAPVLICVTIILAALWSPRRGAKSPGEEGPSAKR